MVCCEVCRLFLLTGILCLWIALRIPHPHTVVCIGCLSCCSVFPCTHMALDSVQHVVVHVPDTNEQSLLPEVETLRSCTHRSRRDVVCWHCGRRGHTRQRCFLSYATAQEAKASWYTDGRYYYYQSLPIVSEIVVGYECSVPCNPTSGVV